MLEITESDIMVDPIRARETLVRLSEMGIHLSVDDFGTDEFQEASHSPANISARVMEV